MSGTLFGTVMATFFTNVGGGLGAVLWAISVTLIFILLIPVVKKMLDRALRAHWGEQEGEGLAEEEETEQSHLVS